MGDAEAVAILFTDLAGSTSRQIEVGDPRFDEIRRSDTPFAETPRIMGQVHLRPNRPDIVKVMFVNIAV